LKVKLQDPYKFDLGYILDREVQKENVKLQYLKQQLSVKKNIINTLIFFTGCSFEAMTYNNESKVRVMLTYALPLKIQVKKLKKKFKVTFVLKR